MEIWYVKWSSPCVFLLLRITIASLSVQYSFYTTGPSLLPFESPGDRRCALKDSAAATKLAFEVVLSITVHLSMRIFFLWLSRLHSVGCLLLAYLPLWKARQVRVESFTQHWKWEQLQQQNYLGFSQRTRREFFSEFCWIIWLLEFDGDLSENIWLLLAS